MVKFDYNDCGHTCTCGRTGCPQLCGWDRGTPLKSEATPKAPDPHGKGKKPGVSYNKFISNKVGRKQH